MKKSALLARLVMAEIGLAVLFPLASHAAPGDLWVSTGNDSISKFSPDTTQFVFSTHISANGLAFDAKGNLYTAESSAINVYPKDKPAGSTLASSLNGPTGLVFDNSGTLYETDFNSGNIFQFTGGVKSTFIGGLNKPTGIAVAPDGRVYVAESTTGTVYRYSVLSGGTKFRTTFASGLTTPQAIAFDAAGNLFIADSGAAAVFKVTPDGTKTTFASSIPAATGLAVDPAGNVFVSEFTSGGSIIQLTPAGGKSTFFTFPNNVFPGWLVFEPAPHLFLNVSTRAPVGTGDDVLIGGFIMNGTGPVNQEAVVRAIGPSLAAFGVPNALQDPVLELHAPDNSIIATNDDWKQNTASVQALIQSLGLAPSDDRESVIYAKLPAGHYTAVVRGAGSSTGNAVVEVYNLQ